VNGEQIVIRFDPASVGEYQGAGASAADFHLAQLGSEQERAPRLSSARALLPRTACRAARRDAEPHPLALDRKASTTTFAAKRPRHVVGSVVQGADEEGCPEHLDGPAALPAALQTLGRCFAGRRPAPVQVPECEKAADSPEFLPRAEEPEREEGRKTVKRGGEGAGFQLREPALRSRNGIRE